MPYLLPHFLTDSAKRFPDREAARFDGKSLTYAELDARTNQIARALQNAGVRRGDRVGFYVHKSLASILSVFGIMKAGAVYVPLDPKSPANRMAYITRNCGIKVLLTSANKAKGVAQLFDEDTPVETILLLDEHKPEEWSLPANPRVISWGDAISLESDPVPNLAIESDLAYILYTSGSTGEPKGVMISHRTIFTFVNWCVDTFSMTENDRVTSHAPLHFDLSTFDIYATIKAGGTVVLVPETLSIFPYKLAQFLSAERITMTYMVPSIFALMLNYGKLEEHDFSTLRYILFAGEVFPIKYLRQLTELIPHPAYYNLYGPTETNVCTYYKVQPKDLLPDETRPVPIGIACENMEVFVVDAAGKLLTEPGIEGELWARGSCVAQGYWGDAVKTGARFVINPYNSQYQEFAFNTGDVVTLDEDGVNWRFIGRRDHMIKSRGYRIELGEIETALYTHPAIKEAVVIAIPDPIVTNRLKAFVVLQEGAELTEPAVKGHCNKTIPSYMIPESVAFMDELPKTSTGKIDRPALLSTELAE